jgi:2-keto-4-pentenoate hydratase/2-oxohepta-3-ene-1,7-dioic acid hydratase in catechol pathway
MSGAITTTPGTLLQVRSPGGTAPFVLVAGEAGKCYYLPNNLRNRPMLDLLTEWEAVDATLAAAELDQLEPASDFEVIAPITYPRAVLCAGANYLDHLQEMGIEPPAVTPPPFFFLKPPTTTVVGSGSTVPLPAGEDPRLDYEAELVVVIGRTARRVDPGEAFDYVAGYTIANDLSARGRFIRPNPIGAAFAFDWLGHKSQDGSCPLGPGLVPARLVADPSALAIRTEVNGVVKQDNTTCEGRVQMGHAHPSACCLRWPATEVSPTSRLSHHTFSMARAVARTLSTT